MAKRKPVSETKRKRPAKSTSGVESASAAPATAPAAQPTAPAAQPTAPATKASLEWARTRLRSAGLRSTAARIAVLQTLANLHVPLSHNDVVERLAEFGFDKSTIYRALTELHEAGLTTRLDLGDAIRRFELVSEESDGTPEHPHYMCVDCGKVVCLSGYRIEIKPDDASLAPPGDVVQVLVKGHCDDCR